ncbi:MAG: 3-hydroxyacyl-CoA dehydrogenase/enoyl-CoA hydratase family protein [Gemmatimonadaceae bacterium]|nr:3-hydroxyacyl-CoA dehydrogenase/enoyl-CoA hydratase family protein [Gemmatimonadaceae bacterium]
MRITKVGVVGAGAMGTGIAALCASAGVPVVLLDMPTDGDRDALARNAVAKALKAKPAPFMDAAHAALISTGNTEDHLPRLADCDWIVEAIVEQIEPKQALFARIEAVAGPDAIVASNTSSIPMHVLTQGRSAAFRRNFLGTHFFNPVRYLHLLEVIPTPETSDVAITRMRRFAERTLGKGVVIARDTPGFIANRLGLFGVVRVLRLMEQFGLTIDEVDAMTGPFIGRPRSATFRTSDISGIDVLAHVAASTAKGTGEDLALPSWVHQLVAEGRLGEKSGAGFYRKDKSGIHTLDWRTMQYAPKVDAFPPELAALQKLPLAERLRGLVTAGGHKAEFVRTLLLDISRYTIETAPDIAHDLVSVDRAMEWGYGWEAGPFRQMDAMGLDVIKASYARSRAPEPRLLAAAHEGFYRALHSGARQLTLGGSYAPIEPTPGLIDLQTLRASGGVIDSNPGAALLDLGDGVLLLEFRGKMNTLGPGVFAMLDVASRRICRGDSEGLVIGNADPRTFTAGADLGLVAAQVQAGDWTSLERSVHEFQQGVLSLRRSPFPVVVAPFGLTLGGGCEMLLHADAVQAHAELYCGLVEVGVGLLPGGGGTKELLFRFTRDLAPYDEADPFEAVRRAFKLISMAVTSTSAAEARRLGILRERDRITMNRDRLLADAKARVLDLAPDYTPPMPMTIRALGREAMGNLEYAVWAMKEGGYISDHDVQIGQRIAYVLSGGDGPPRDVTEQDVLDLEREAFLGLLGTRETQERIAHMLATGKPLRN